MEAVNILEHPHPVLREKCKLLPPSEFGTVSLLHLVKEMFITLEKQEGAGLAAPQVGYPIRMFVVRPGIIPAFEERNGFAVSVPVEGINPFIIPDGTETEYADEGCLSIPNAQYRIRRHKRIKMSWQNANGAIREEWLEGWAARVCQHEEDHLHGTLILDKGRPVRK